MSTSTRYSMYIACTLQLNKEPRVAMHNVSEMYQCKLCVDCRISYRVT